MHRHRAEKRSIAGICRVEAMTENSESFHRLFWRAHMEKRAHKQTPSVNCTFPKRNEKKRPVRKTVRDAQSRGNDECRRARVNAGVLVALEKKIQELAVNGYQVLGPVQKNSFRLPIFFIFYI